jgi:hypothetical protein
MAWRGLGFYSSRHDLKLGADLSEHDLGVEQLYAVGRIAR